MPATGTGVLDYQTKIDWFGTVRARLGYVWGNGEALSYVTGGLAYGRVGINGTSAPILPGGTAVLSQAFSHWVLGYGTEDTCQLMPGNWTWKVETLYMDLGTLDSSAPSGSATIFPGAPSFGTLTVAGGPVATHSHFTDWILRGGLNYQFH